MGTLRQSGTGRVVALPARALVGRGRACQVRLAGALVSGEHAALRFADGGWSVRDLASRNGTWVAGERIEPGIWVALGARAEVAFGDPEATWTLIDDDEPGPMAVCLEDETVLLGRSSVLALPDEQDPVAMIRREGDDWVLDADEIQPVVDGGTVEVAGTRYRVHVPSALPETEVLASEPSLGEVRLRVAVSRDQERVDVRVGLPLGSVALQPRSYHYLLVVLAQHLEQDTARDPIERGWIDSEWLAHRLRIPKRTMDVQICRIRAQFRDLGIAGADRVVERRGAHVRLGTSRFELALLE